MITQRMASIRVSWLLTLAAFLAGPVIVSAQQVESKKTERRSQEKSRAAERAKAEARAVKTPIDLNSASAKELMEIPGVGEATARKIIEGRPYRSVESLAAAGVPETTIAKIKPHATVRSLPPPVDLNRATAAQLETLPGVGPAKAKAIIADRPYATMHDLAKVKGFGRAEIEALHGRVSFGDAVATKTPTTRPLGKAATAEKKTVEPYRTTKVPAAKKPAARATVAASEKGKGEVRTNSSKPKLAPGQKININKASSEDLQMLPGIGPVHAQAIIDARPFDNPEDVMKIKGIKEVEYGKIKDHIVVK